MDMGGGDKEYDDDDDDNESSALLRQPPMGSSMTSSSAFFPPDTASDDDQAQGDCDGDGDGDGWVEARDRRTEASEKGKQHRLAGGRAAGGTGKGAELPTATVSARQDTFSEQSGGEVPRLDREEEEIVALSSYLACARGRGWPWSGKDILWAEYVSLNGHHR